jgi:WD40 repeat protein
MKIKIIQIILATIFTISTQKTNAMEFPSLLDISTKKMLSEEFLQACIDEKSHEHKCIKTLCDFENLYKSHPTITERLPQRFIETKILKGHSCVVNSIAFRPDGKLLATGSWDETARIWNPRTGKCKHILKGHSNIVATVAFTSVTFSPNSKLLATVSCDKTTRIWNTETGEHLQTLTKHDDEIISPYFSSDNKLIATRSFDKTAQIWDTKTGEFKQALKGHEDIIISIAFSSDSKLIATGSWDETARIWNTETGKCKQILVGHTNGVNSVSFKSNGKLLETKSIEQTTKIWDIETGKCLQTIKSGTQKFYPESHSLNGNLLATYKWPTTDTQIWKRINRLDQLFLIYIIEYFKKINEEAPKEIFQSELFKKAWNGFSRYEQIWLYKEFKIKPPEKQSKKFRSFSL